MKKLSICITLVLLMGLALSACAPGSPTTSPQTSTAIDAGQAAQELTPTPEAAPDVVGAGPTQIVVWHRWEGEYYKAIKEIFAEYAAQNNVQIELLLVQNVADKAQLAVPSGQGPDIIAWVNDRLGDSALSKIIQPLNTYSIDESYLRANFADVATDAMIYKGQVYGIPESLEAMTFIYNKALITEEELPKTTDELLAKAATYNQPPEKYLFVYNAKGDIYAAACWFQAMGVQLVKEDGTTDVGNEASVKALELIKRFSEIMPAESDYGTADALFKDGKAAIILNGPWAIADYQAKGIDIGLTPVPIVSASGKPGAPFVGVKLLMLAENAKNPEAAVELMKYYGSAEVQAKLAQINKQVPANKTAQEMVKDDPIIAGFIAQAANGRPMPSSEYIAAMWDPFNKMIEAVWTGAATPEQAAADGAALFAQKVADMQ
ncbi:extracellular solute-binding protein [Caldilinea sp.]|jgi:maltose-binding protein MalE|uniref:sugar ABC transporter substrate-binding protein n=1 Tax=Caldilinea sp. TaxID=2293560 RepID=UPI0021DD9F81|nr:extracellular solute-binding protein [Caldilinea sp.]GIV73488.1 MAG: ABC transporter substrate-binding protein [Caldilinea sp.]